MTSSNAPVTEYVAATPSVGYVMSVGATRAEGDVGVSFETSVGEPSAQLMSAARAINGASMAMRLGVNYPQGPLKWADQIGLDEVLAVLEGLQRETGDDRYRPAPLMKKLVIAGFFGEVSGKGFYPYKEGQVKP